MACHRAPPRPVEGPVGVPSVRSDVGRLKPAVDSVHGGTQPPSVQGGRHRRGVRGGSGQAVHCTAGRLSSRTRYSWRITSVPGIEFGIKNAEEFVGGHRVEVHPAAFRCGVFRQ